MTFETEITVCPAGILLKYPCGHNLWTLRARQSVRARVTCLTRGFWTHDVPELRGAVLVHHVQVTRSPDGDTITHSEAPMPLQEFLRSYQASIGVGAMFDRALRELRARGES
jgi:hypothetical protein